MTDDLELLERDGAIGLRVRVKPRARRTEIVGVEAGVLIVALAAQPHDGQANRELLRFFAQLARIPASRIELASGATARVKLIRFRGADHAELRRRLLDCTVASK